MASSSQVPQIKHDVFISFRGEDTRRGFVSHLNKALRQKHDVFVDDKLERGDEISTALLGAIETSQISLIIFSKDYASSKWSLDELVKIMECHERSGQVVIPIFYNTDPSDVRNQKGSYGDAFSENGKKCKVNMAKMQKWRIALKKAANLSGFHYSSEFGTEANLIKQIVEDVPKRLKNIDLRQNIAKVPVGICEEVAFLESLAMIDSEAVRIIGIWGMGGIGKTTIAKELYKKLWSKYEAHCFVNVREELEKDGVTHLQNKIVCDILKEKDGSIGCEYDMKRLRRKKVLLVLDDVDDLRKMRNLDGGHGWFGPGSTVIVTSRDKQVLATVVDYTYEVKALKFEDSLQLFSLNAFKEICPKLEWMDLSKRALNYAQGIPLAIKVLGSTLFCQEREMWESLLEKVKKLPIPEIQNVLRLSYDGLDREEEDIFLYLACFFESGDFCISVLDDCGYSTRAGMTKLCNKALLAVDGASDNEVTHWNWTMHDLIRYMGKEIVCGESRDPGNRRHLWDPHDVYQVLKNATGTGAIQSLTLDRGSTSKELHLSPKAFNGMSNLKFLKLHTYGFKMFAPKNLESMPDGLRLLYWEGCPLKSLPSSFCAENLVELDLSHSSLERLWDGVQNLVKLELIILRGCKQLTELPDFSKAFKLRYVDLSMCTSLCALHPSICSLQLSRLGLYGCKKLKSIWSDLRLNNICSLSAKGYSCMTEFSEITDRVEFDLSETGIEEVRSLGLRLKKLEFLNYEFSKRLPHNFLQVLDLWEMRKFTLDFFAPCYFLQWLHLLSLSGCNIETLPESIKHLSVLSHLCLYNCTMLRFLPELPPSVSLLDVGNCVSLEEVSISTDDCYGALRDIYLFSNCWRLNQRTLNTIMSDALVKMKQAAFIHRLAPSPSRENRIFVCLPGSKLPADRYHYRTTTEATLTIQLSPLSSFLGLIFCAVVSPCQINWHYPVARYRCYLQTSNGPEVYFETNIHNDFRLDAQFDSDHVFLWHQTDLFKSEIENIIKSSADNQCRIYNPKLSITISTEEPIKVKEWGIYPIYASDLFNFSDQLALGAKTKSYREADKLLDKESLRPAKKLKTEWKKMLEFEPTA